MISEEQIKYFRKTLTSFYSENKRMFLWRQPEADGTFDPYKIMVSEIMLQQTQTSRVTPYYEKFLHKYPSVRDLANSNLADVLETWKGLGYNRRARYLCDAARILQNDYGLNFPRSLKELVALPGIGANTAGAILVYAFNKPEVFIETNIRSVYIHHFFSDRESLVHDQEIAEMLKQTIDRDDPREFYWALMDYGTWLKSQGSSNNTKSAHYVRQSSFDGSSRQLRSQVLKIILHKPVSEAELTNLFPDKRLKAVIRSLANDRLIEFRQGRFFIPQ